MKLFIRSMTTRKGVFLKKEKPLVIKKLIAFYEKYFFLLS